MVGVKFEFEFDMMVGCTLQLLFITLYSAACAFACERTQCCFFVYTGFIRSLRVSESQ